MMKNLALRTAAAGAAVAAPLLLMPSTASAAGASTTETVASGPHHWMYSDDDNPGGRLDFWPAQDKMRVCDLQKDGYSAQAEIGHEGRLLYRLKGTGKGDCQTFDKSDKDLREGECFDVTIGLYKNGRLLDQSWDWAIWRNDNDEKINCPQ